MQMTLPPYVHTNSYVNKNKLKVERVVTFTFLVSHHVQIVYEAIYM